MASLQRYSSHGHSYWRIVESYRDHGRPKIRLVKHLGTVEDLLALLAGAERKVRVRSTAHGAVAALLDVATELGVVDAVDEAIASFTGDPVPQRCGLTPGQTCLLIALGRACHPTSKRGWHVWARDTSLPELWRLRPDELTSQFFWDQMHEVPLEVLPGIEQRLAARALEVAKVPLDLLLYDTTNYFTFIASTNSRTTLAQRGRNKQKRHDLRQFGVALLVSRQGQLPLWHQVYEGDTPDVKHFPTALTKLRERIAAMTRDVAEITLVYDRGNNASKDNQALVDGSTLHYVAALTPANHAELIAEANCALQPVEVRPQEEVPTWQGRRVVWGAERTVVIYVSEQLREGQVRGLYQHLGKATTRLAALATALASQRCKRRSQSEVEGKVAGILQGQYLAQVVRFSLKEREPGRWDLTYWVDADAYENLVENHFGRRILITNRHDWTAAEIQRAYRGQSEVEDAFESLKDPFHLAVRPQYHWTDQKIAVHTWCCVLAYLLARLVHLRLTERLGYSGTLRTMLDDLGQIRRATVIQQAPGRKGRPRLQQVLDHPEDPFIAAMIDTLSIRP